MDRVEIRDGVLSVEEVSASVSDPECGAISLFAGALLFFVPHK